MKAVKIALAGRDRYLAFTVEAMFQIEEAFGGTQELNGRLMESSREGFADTCKAAAILAEQGELARRHMGYEPSPMLSAEDIATTTDPMGLPTLKSAIISAIMLGYGREIEPEDDEVDLGLAELNEQKKRGEAGPLPPDRGAVRVLP